MSGDYKPYQPALLPQQVRSLYFLKLESGKPMTWHARRAVALYLEQFPEIRFDEGEIRRTQRRYPGGEPHQGIDGED